jgi:hypothetical protein
LAINQWDTGLNRPVPTNHFDGGIKMPGTILSAVARRRIADCHIKTAQYVTNRQGLIEIWQAARISLQKGELFEEVCIVLAARANELGVYKKGVK